MHHTIYRTSSKSGKYYIGRHSTNNVNDGYLGSGNWVKSIKNDGTFLCKEILCYANDIVGGVPVMARYHFDKCKNNPINNKQFVGILQNMH